MPCYVSFAITLFFSSPFIILYCGNGVIADAIFTNLWAVRVHFNLQEAKELATKHGFSYEKHVSFTLVLYFTY